MNSSLIMKEEVQIYQKHNFFFYFIRTEHKKLHEKSIQIQPLSFSFNNNNQDFLSIYEITSKQIDQYISINDVQINYSQDGLSNAIVCAYIIIKGFDLESAFQVMDFLQIDRPTVYYLSSLKRLDNQINSVQNLNRSSIILKTDLDLDQTIQNSLLQSEILNFPIFSQRLIETQRNSQILPSEYQATSEIFNQQQISFISFGQQDLQNINEEPQINKIQSSIFVNKKQ
ncbi:unnamed protein product [Paramecium primaurelia]|uniref:Uncharacterized protein n=1 Tax=Paramecium primaurelia TaxID=5886 RepID=A0A8S1LZM0_PARPR|nr:unnamed protein product [Paramecium primaurelia]